MYVYHTINFPKIVLSRFVSSFWCFSLCLSLCLLESRFKKMFDNHDMKMSFLRFNAREYGMC